MLCYVVLLLLGPLLCYAQNVEDYERSLDTVYDLDHENKKSKIPPSFQFLPLNIRTAEEQQTIDDTNKSFNLKSQISNRTSATEETQKFTHVNQTETSTSEINYKTTTIKENSLTTVNLPVYITVRKNDPATVNLPVSTTMEENDPATINLPVSTTTEENDPATINLSVFTTTEENDPATINLPVSTTTEVNDSTTVNLPVSTTTEENNPTAVNLPVSTTTTENDPAIINSPVSTTTEENDPATINLPVSTTTRENDPTTVNLPGFKTTRESYLTTVNLPESTTTEENDPTAVHLPVSTTTRENDPAIVNSTVSTTTEENDPATINLPVSTTTRENDPTTINLPGSKTTRESYLTTVNLLESTTTEENDPTAVHFPVSTTTRENDPAIVNSPVSTTTEENDPTTVNLLEPKTTRENYLTTVNLPESTTTRETPKTSETFTTPKIIDSKTAIPEETTTIEQEEMSLVTSTDQFSLKTEHFTEYTMTSDKINLSILENQTVTESSEDFTFSSSFTSGPSEEGKRVTLIWTPKNTTVIRSDPATFFCKLNTTEITDVTWARNGVELIPTQGTKDNDTFRIVKVKNGCVLRILRVLYDWDEDRISCVIRKKGQNKTINVDSWIKMDPNPTCDFPRITFHPQPTKVVKAGGNVTYSCNANGYPPPNFFWLKDMVPIPTEERFNVDIHGNLTIKDIVEKDGGKYECIAENEKGSIMSRGSHLYVGAVQVPPYFVERPPSRVNIIYSDNLTLECVAGGEPAPTVQWRNGSKVLVEGEYEAVLNVKGIWTEHTLTCFVSSPLGTLTADTKVILSRFHETPTHLEAVHVNQTSVTISWRFNKERETFPPTHYIIQYKDSYSTRYLEATSTNLTATILNLTPFNEYVFYVLAVNKLGFSEPSAPLTVKTKTGVPATAPQDVQVRVDSETTVELSWKPPREANGIIQGYEVFYTDNSYLPLDNWKKMTVRGATVFLANLKPRTKYFVVVAAFTLAGRGPLSSTKHFVTQLDAILFKSDFESEYHGWTFGIKSKVNWTRQYLGRDENQRAGPVGDHTSGSGFYFAVNTLGQTRGDLSYLISPLIETTKYPFVSISFWFHMFGHHTGYLRLRLLKNMTEGEILWSAVGNHGDRWLEARVAIGGNFPVQVVFEAEMRHGSVGVIALDDVTVEGGTYKPVQDPVSCDFEEGFCGWSYNHVTDSTWIINRGSTWERRIEKKTFGPDSDSKGTGGWYIYVNKFQGSLQKAVILSKELNLAVGEFRCLRFWYHLHSLYSTNIYFTSLAVELWENNTVKERLWESWGTHDDRWLKAEVSILGVGRPFQIAFKGNTTSNPTGTAALDEILIDSGTCSDDSTAVNCSFGSGTCGWFLDHLGVYVSWRLWRSNAGGGSFRPLFDVDGDGYYLYMSVYSHRSNDYTRIVSSSISVNTGETRCLSFWYFLHGPDVGQLQIYLRSEEGVDTQVWSRKGNHGNRWLQGKILLTISVKVVFEAVISYSAKAGDIALDAISLTNDSCIEELSSFCDFEYGLCGWTQGVDKITTNFVLQQGALTTHPQFGPQWDDSLGVRLINGWYVYMEGTQRRNAAGHQVASLVSSWLLFSGIDCLQFSYYMVNSKDIFPHELKVYVTNSHNNSVGVPVWTTFGHQDQRWIHIYITLRTPPSSLNKVVFEGIKGAESFPTAVADIALDEINVLNGACVKDSVTVSCTFDYGLCGWTRSQDFKFHWSVQRGAAHWRASKNSGPYNDHTYPCVSQNSEDGYYLVTNAASSSKPGDTTRLISPIIYAKVEMKMCLKFWYHLHQSNSYGKLQVYLCRGSNCGTTVWSRFGAHGDRWMEASIPLFLENGTDTQVVFEAVQSDNGYQFHIAIDDITVDNELCEYDQQETELCDFEKHMCWWQQGSDDGTNWIMQQGSTSLAPGPMFDHKHLQYKEGGWYLALKLASKRNARIFSPPLTGTKCFRLWYYMYRNGTFKSDIHELSIYQYVPKTKERNLLWTNWGDHGDRWLEASITFPSLEDPYQIVIEGHAVNNQRYIIALDDLELKPGACISESKQVECDFEAGSCGWILDSSSTANWTVAKGAISGSAGPQADHTTGAGGRYAVYESPGNSWTLYQGLLRSPPIVAKENVSSCIQFWFSMFGPYMQYYNLTVHLVRNGQLSPPVWSTWSNHGKNWLLAEAPLLPPFPVQAAFVVQNFYHSYAKTYIALDDIKVIEGKCFAYSINCTFVDGICGWNRGGSGTFRWEMEKATCHQTRIENCKDEFYVVTKGGSKKDDRTWLKTPVIKIEDGVRKCLTFWYYMNVQSNQYLGVFFEKLDGMKQQLWHRLGEHGNRFMNAKISLEGPLEGRVLFESWKEQNGRNIDIILDDVALLDSLCPLIDEIDTIDCDFEDNLCGWQQDDKDQLNWIMHSGSSPVGNLGPPSDHTKAALTEGGWYLELRRWTAVGGILSGGLQSPTIHVPREDDRCLEFWYHMAEANIRYDFRFDVNLLNRNGSIAYKLWEEWSNHGRRWLKASIGIRGPFEGMIQFLGSGYFYHNDKNIALDDIKLSKGKCKNNNRNIINCTFDNGTCGWLTNSPTLWRLQYSGVVNSSIPGGNFYIQPVGTTDKQMLISPSVSTPLGEALCFTFWYRMVGYSNIKLNMGVLYANDTFKILWSRYGELGNLWLKASITLPGESNPYQIAFTAYHQGLHDAFWQVTSQINLDLLTITDGVCSHDTSKDLNCTFENGFCGWRNRDETPAHWVLQCGFQTKLKQGPYWDHTYWNQKPYGSFIFLKPNTDESKTKQLISPTIHPELGFPKCLKFAYYLSTEKPEVHTVPDLRVLLFTPKTGTADAVWTDIGSWEGRWLTANITLEHAENPYKVIFEGPKSNITDTVTIAIDDISYTEQACEKDSRTVNCSFDSDICGWSYENQIPMHWLKTSSINNPVPPFNSPANGHSYMYAKKLIRNYNRGEKASLTSPPILNNSPGEKFCLTFVYYMYGDLMGQLNVYIVKNDTVDAPVWTRSGNHGNRWIQAFIPFSLDIAGRVRIEAVNTEANSQDPIALDNVVVKHGSCDQIEENSETFDCDFSGGFCGWRHSGSVVNGWMLNSGPTPNRQIGKLSGPSNDYNGDGWYVFVNTDGAVLSSPVQKNTGPMCLSLAYHIYGDGLDTLLLRITLKEFGENTSSVILWEEWGDHGDQWLVTQVTVNPKVENSKYQLLLEGILGAKLFTSTSDAGDIAVDNVSIIHGSCKIAEVTEYEIFQCDFEEFNCGIQLDWNTETIWIRRKGPALGRPQSGPLYDHTTGDGWYLQTRSVEKNGKITARMFLPLLHIPSVESCCLSFWYHQQGKAIDNLAIYVDHENGTEASKVKWSQHHQIGNVWNYEEVTVFGGEKPIKIYFVGQRLPTRAYTQGIIGIDDIIVKPGPCSFDFEEEHYCDFEKGLCGWTIVSSFIRDRGGVGDHTYESGWYMTIETTNVWAKLVSRSFMNSVGQKRCFSFWRNMQGNNMENVFMTVEITKPVNKKVWSDFSGLGNRWLYDEVTIEATEEADIEITVMGYHPSGGQVLLDDVKIQKGACTGSKQGVNCTFDEGSCGWMNESPTSTAGHWVIYSGATPHHRYNTGPEADHTTGDGWYAYFKSFRGPSSAVAVLKSPDVFVGHLSRTMCISFYYHMYGVGNGHLYLLINKGNTAKTVWEVSGNQKQLWRRATVPIIVSNIFNLAFKGTRAYTSPNYPNNWYKYLDEMAVDDVTLTDGPCTQELPSSCASLYYLGETRSGVYKIWPKGVTASGKRSFEVYCNMDTFGGGWTVIQRRGDFGEPRENFHRDWNEYKNGFGLIAQEFWLGNENLFMLTNQESVELLVTLSINNITVQAKYLTFFIDREVENYRLHVSGYSGTAGDSLSFHNNKYFSTKDSDNDGWREHCAQKYESGWWFSSCLEANLNGRYYTNETPGDQQGIIWQNFSGVKLSLMSASMMIRPVDFQI